MRFDNKMLFLLSLYFISTLSVDCASTATCAALPGADKYSFCTGGQCTLLPCSSGRCFSFRVNPPSSPCFSGVCTPEGGFPKRSEQDPFPCFFSDCDSGLCVPRNCDQKYQCLTDSDCGNSNAICRLGTCKPIVSCSDNFDCNMADDELCVDNICKVVSCLFRRNNTCPLSQTSVRGCFNPFCNENAHCQAINCSAQGSGGENAPSPSFSPFLIFILISIFIMLLIILLVLWCARRKSR